MNLYLSESYGGGIRLVFVIIVNHIPLAVHFYVSSYFTLLKFIEKKYLQFASTIAISLSTYYTIRYLYNMYVFPFLGIPKRYEEISEDFWYDTIYLFVLWFIYSMSYFYARKTVEQEKELRILQVAKAEAEMKFLKAQINPHFMFNTLNLINNKVRAASKSASDVVLQLAEMFRYITGNETQKDLVSLQDEINFVFNYVDMLNKRNSYTMAFVIDQEGDFSKHQITPMVLITILENAFKHGEVFDQDNPLIIIMQMNSENLFTFSTQNKLKVEEQKGGSTGIGIGNITQRLKAVHGETFSLNSHFNNETQEYFCTLVIQY